MTFSEKLHLIRTLSGSTQEEMARKLGVSFVTLNRWLGGKAFPRKGAQSKIDGLYEAMTGQKQAPEQPLLARKKLLLKKKERHRNVLKIILNQPDIHDQFVLSLTYNTNRIEGSTLTEPETAAILFQNASFPNHSLTEQMEVKNHQAGWRYLLKHLLESGTISEEVLLKLHGILMNGIREDAGTYRRHPVRIAGSRVVTANFLKIPHLMRALVEDIAGRSSDPLSHVAEIHARFEQIHPYSDGNGRVGRLLVQAMLLKAGFSPAVIQQKKRRHYLSALSKAQLTGDREPLENFICDAILAGYQILERRR